MDKPSPLRRSLRLARWILPISITLVVFAFELVAIPIIIRTYGLEPHILAEAIFFGLTGPVALWFILGWIDGQLARKEAAEARAREVVSEERNRIARDIHDGVAQDLAFLILKTDLAKKSVVSDSQKAEEHLGEIKEGLRRGIGEVRRIIFALRPADLEEMGFWPAVRKLASDFQEMAGVDVDFKLQGEGSSLAPAVETTVFRLLQESLNNVAKHSFAQKVWVSLSVNDGRYVAGTVEDNGRGFDPQKTLAEAQERGSWGLGYMHERVEALGGSLSIESTPGKGAVVRWSIPIGEK